MKKKTICFDIDGIVCITKNLNYNKSKPIKKNIEFINKLYNVGYNIIIFTGRYMGRNNNNIVKAKKQGFKKTYKQLKKWNLKFSKLYFGKPSFDLFVDDKAYNFNKNWRSKIKRKLINNK